MRKSEIFNLILEMSSDVCEVRKESLLNSRCRVQSVVDARCITVVFLRKAGLTDDDIAFFALRGESGLQWPEWEDITRRGRSYEALRKSFEDRSIQSLAFREMVKLLQGQWDEQFLHTN